MFERKIRILHLEDLATDVEIINRVLTKEKIAFETCVVDKRDEYIKALTEFKPDIVLCDHSLPFFNSIEALDILKERDLQIPFILVTGAVSEEFAAQIIKQGADDYILKDRPGRLALSILASLEKHRLARDVKKSQAHFQNIFNKSLDVLCIIDQEGRFSEVSAASRKVWGYEPWELIGKPYIEMVLNEDKDITVQKALEIMAGLNETNFENRYLSKNGEVKSIVWSATWDNNTNTMYCIARDATEQRKAEKAFRDSQKQYIDLVNNLPAAVYSCNIKGEIVLFNHAAEVLWGRKPIIGKDLWCGSWQIFSRTGDEVLLDDCPMALTLKTGTAVEGEEIIIKRPDGTYRNIQPHPIPTFDSEGLLTGAVNMLIDITERKIAEKEVQLNIDLLRKAASRQSAILNALPANIALLDEYGIIVEVNQAWVDFGKENGLQSPNSAIGENYIAISKNNNESAIAGEGMDIATGIAEVINGNLKEFALEYPCHSPNQKRWFQERVSPTSHEGNRGAVVMHIDISDRKLAEEKVKQSEINLNVVIENADALVYSIDCDYRYITFNSRLRNSILQQYGMEIKVGERVFDFLEKDQFSEARYWEETYKEALSGKSLKLIKDYSNNGKPSFMSFSINPIKKAETVIGLSCFVRDITESKIAEEELKASEQRYRQVSHNSIMGIKWLSSEGKILNANDAFSKMLGYTHAEILEMNFIELIHKDDLPRQQETMIQLFSGKVESDRFEKRYVTKHGEVLWGELILTPFTGTDGLVKYVIGLVQNITDRKKAEHALKEKTYILEKAQEVAHIGYWHSELAQEGTLTWSEEIYRIFGHDIDEGIDVDKFYSLVHPEDRETVSALFMEALRQRKRYFVEHRIVLSDNSVRWVQQQADPFTDSDGQISSIIGVCRDITEHKLAEEKIRDTENELRELNAELEERVIQRTNELLDANRELDAFSYTVSHDLRTPIRAIQIFGNLLKEKIPTTTEGDFSKYLGNILICTEEMNLLINDMLEFSKLGRTSLSKSVVNMNAMVSTITDRILITDYSEEIDIQTGSLHNIEADATLLRSVWLNLISNAVKYRRKGIATIIRINSDVVNDTIVYSVEDNGTGFNMKYYDQLFKPFSRLHSQEEYSGTGAGLAICERIIKKHGGEIWAESVVGQGSVFYFSLPIKNS